MRQFESCRAESAEVEVTEHDALSSCAVVVGVAAWIAFLLAQPLNGSARTGPERVEGANAWQAAPAPATLGRIASTGHAVVVGRVVDAATGEAIPGAVVAIGAADQPARPDLTALLRAGPGRSHPDDPRVQPVPKVLSDAAGAFLVSGLPAGSFHLVASKTGYTDGAYGRLVAEDVAKPLVLTDGQVMSAVTIRLFRNAVIRGRVMNDLGEPVVDAKVVAYTWTWLAGHPRLGRAERTTRTDGSGEYRLSDLRPGSYLVHLDLSLATRPRRVGVDAVDSLGRAGLRDDMGAVSWQARAFLLDEDLWVHSADSVSSPVLLNTAAGAAAYSSQFHVAAYVPEAANPVAVPAGGDVSGIDFAIAPRRAVRVSGELVVDGASPAGRVVHLVPADGNLLSLNPPVAVTLTDADGSFMFPGVPDGSYLVQFVRGPRPELKGLSVVGSQARVTGRETTQAVQWARASVTVSGTDVGGLLLKAQPGYTITGILRMQPGGRTAAATALKCFLHRSDGLEGSPSPACRITADQRIEVDGILPGSYVFDVVAPGARRPLASVRMGSVDVTDRPFEVQSNLDSLTATLAAQPARLRGSVLPAAGQSATPVSVVVFPTDRSAWSDYGPAPRRLREAAVDAQGAWMLSDIPEGEYYAALLSPDQVPAWRRPEFMARLARTAVRFSVRAGEDQYVAVSRSDVGGGGLEHGPWVPGEDQDSGGRESSGPLAVRLEGRVQSVDGGFVPRARVVAYHPDRPFATTTDDEGRFSVTVPLGHYTVFAEKPGFMRGYYGATRPGATLGVPVAARSSGPPLDLQIRLVPAATICGDVRLDGYGLPGAEVRAIDVEGRASARGRITATTDDRGRYRLQDLAPGRYLVQVTPPTLSLANSVFAMSPAASALAQQELVGVRSGAGTPSIRALGQLQAVPGTPGGTAVTLGRVYYPGVNVPREDSHVAVEPGETRCGIDVNVTFVQTGSVEGQVVDAAGLPVSGASIRVRPTDLHDNSDGLVYASGTDGRFQVPDLLPGAYEFVATARRTSTPSATGLGRVEDQWARARLEVAPGGRHLASLELQPGVRVTGRLVFPEGFMPDRMPVVALEAVTPPGRSSASVDEHGRFELRNVQPGLYRWSLGTANARGVQLWPRAVAGAVGGENVIDAVVDLGPASADRQWLVAYTATPATLTGTVVDEQGRPAVDVLVLLFSVDEARWHSQSRFVPAPVQPATDGTFRFAGVPPGEYYLGAVIPQPSLMAELHSPVLLREAASRALKVLLVEDRTTIQPLQLARPRR